MKIILPLIVNLVIISPFYLVEADKNKCTDECLTKTYCLSNDGSTQCSKNNLVTAQFGVLKKSSSTEMLHLTLTGYNIEATKDHTVRLSFRKNSAKTIFTCYKSPLGATKASVFQGSTEYGSGSSYYQQDLLTCSWIFSRSDPIWPAYYNNPVDLISDKSFALQLDYDTLNGTVAQDTSELPIYRMKFLKCCNHVYGTDNYLLIINQTDQTDFYAQVMDVKPSIMTIALTNVDKTVLAFKCYFKIPLIQGYIQNGTKSTTINDQLFDTYIYNSRCSWSIHSYLNASSTHSSLDISKGTFNLQINSDDHLVYSEENISLRSSSPSLSSVSMNLIILIIIKLLSI
uniref:CUB domain-containing protein n=1 Tax=Tetranychus urticae TaxID=32264 RepID=T1KH03_TETUR